MLMTSLRVLETLDYQFAEFDSFARCGGKYIACLIICVKFLVDVRFSHNVCLGVLTCAIISVHALGHRPVSAFTPVALSILFALCQQRRCSLNEVAI